MIKLLRTICLFGFCTLTFACSGDGAKTNLADTKVKSSTKKEVNNNVPAKQVVASTKATKERFPRLRMLPSNPNTTEYTVGTIGGQRINKKTVQPIEVSGEKLVVTGWAIDKPANQVPGELFIDIDGQKYGVVKGKSPKYLEKMFENPALHTAGFRGNLPLSKLTKGKHKLSLYVIAADKKSFYTPKESYEIIIK